jgi:D-inositol-3-phosphate glycosyltransferase
MNHQLEESQRRPRLLIVGDAVAPTGFATVMHNIFGRLTGEYEIHHLGINYFGDPHDKPWKIYPASAGGGHPYGIHRMKPLIRDLRPELVFLLNDLWVLGDYLTELREFQPKLKIVAYCPVDAGPLDDRYLERLAGLDRLVTYTRYGQAVLAQAAADLGRRKPDVHLPAIDVLPHGVDTASFHPLIPGDAEASRAQALRTLFDGNPDLDGAFIVLNANRNQPRKRIDITLKGFALFARNKPDKVRLYLHMGAEDGGWDIFRLGERLGVSHRLLVSTFDKQLPRLPTDKLNLIYNAAPVGLNTSWGEGWGLVSFEHAATRAAQVVPRHSACAELWTGAALLIEPRTTLTVERILCEAHLVSPEDVAEALERLYQDPALLAELSQAAHENALRPEYQWDAIARRWSDLFGELLALEVTSSAPSASWVPLASPASRAASAPPDPTASSSPGDIQPNAAA